jgi:hypothetical protein
MRNIRLYECQVCFTFVYKPVVYKRKVFSLSRRTALQTRCKGALRCVFGHVDTHSMPNIRTAAT